MNKIYGKFVPSKKAIMTELTLALDWTPNINHIGFFVAKQRGFYSKQGLKVRILDPITDDYRITPAKKVELGQADFALCPTESLISYQTKSSSFPLKAIAAILQDDLSAIAVRVDSDIQSPRDLDGKTYASYQARYEDGIVQQMIKNDGGEGQLEIVYPQKLGIFETLLSGKYDSTWIFLNWEAVAVDASGESLRYFKMEDYGIPYSYSPVLAANAGLLEEKAEAYRAFLAATKEGYLYAQDNPQAAIRILQLLVPPNDQQIDLVKSLMATAPHFGTATNWGRMQPAKVTEFLEWIRENGLEKASLTADDLVTNELLQ
jgi:ABC-type nitrate/sulfonate/bicarbonate transport system substrate-binding protein